MHFTQIHVKPGFSRFGLEKNTKSPVKLTVLEKFYSNSSQSRVFSVLFEKKKLISSETHIFRGILHTSKSNRCIRAVWFEKITKFLVTGSFLIVSRVIFSPNLEKTWKFNPILSKNTRPTESNSLFLISPIFLAFKMFSSWWSYTFCLHYSKFHINSRISKIVIK